MPQRRAEIDAAAKRRFMTSSFGRRPEQYDEMTRRWNELGEMTRAIYRTAAVRNLDIRLSLDERDHAVTEEGHEPQGR